MLQKLRSRHPIDLPTSGFGRNKVILAVLGGTAVLFVLLPFLLSPLVAVSQSAVKVVIAVGAAFGTLALVLLVAGAKGKFGWQR